jgi:hypothetical protein
MIVMSDDQWLVLPRYTKKLVTRDWHYTFSCGHWADHECEDPRLGTVLFTWCGHCERDITVTWEVVTWTYEVTLDCGHILKNEVAPPRRPTHLCSECGHRWNVAGINRFIADWKDTRDGSLRMVADSKPYMPFGHPHALEGPLTQS